MLIFLAAAALAALAYAATRTQRQERADLADAVQTAMREGTDPDALDALAAALERAGQHQTAVVVRERSEALRAARELPGPGAPAPAGEPERQPDWTVPYPDQPPFATPPPAAPPAAPPSARRPPAARPPAVEPAAEPGPAEEPAIDVERGRQAHTLARQVAYSVRRRGAAYDRSKVRAFQRLVMLDPDGLYGGAVRGAVRFFGVANPPAARSRPTREITYVPPAGMAQPLGASAGDDDSDQLAAAGE